MMRLKERKFNERGLTLVELMVAVTLFGMLAAGTLFFFQGQQKTTVDQQKSLGMQDNVRAPLDFIARHIRAVNTAFTNTVAGIPGQIFVESAVIPYAVPSACAAGGNWFPVIEVFSGGFDDPSPPPPTAATNDRYLPDALRIIALDGNKWGSLHSDNIVAANAPLISPVRIKTLDPDNPGFVAGDWIMIIGKDGSGNFDRAMVFRATSDSTSCGPSEFCVTKGNGANIPFALQENDFVIGVKWLEFRVGTFSGQPSLLLKNYGTGTGPGITTDEEPIAVGIEDFQIAMGFDPGADGIGPENPQSDGADEWVFNYRSGLEATWPNAGPANCNLLDFRALRITLVGIGDQDMGQTRSMSRRPQIEDHPPGPVDGLPRSIATMVVAPRVKN